MQLLQVDSSILGANSASRQLTAKVVEAERRRVPGLTVVYRDLAADPLGHIYGSETPMGSFDHQEPYLRNLFGFLGITDISVVRAEGLAMGDNRAASMDAAHSAIAAMA